MPFIETVCDLAEWLADKVGVYGAHDEKCADPSSGQTCRICWTEEVEVRIRKSVENESVLAESTKRDCPPCTPPPAPPGEGRSEETCVRKEGW